MKKGAGLVELLIVVVVILALFLTLHKSKYGRSNPFDDNSGTSSGQEFIEDKIQDIEDTKALKKRIEDNLKEGY